MNEESARKLPQARLSFWLAATFLVATFLLGGGARSDILSLVLLRPLAAIVLAIGIWRLSPSDIEKGRLLFGCLAAVALLAIVQLLPLPPFVWHALPGHDIVRRVDTSVGLEGLWRPISLVPNATLNALLSLLVPAAFLVHLVKLGSGDTRRMLVVLVALGLVSAIVGIAQIVGSPGSRLYFYRITNTGFAVGLFSNRNHQAAVLACLFPMLAAYASFPAKQPTIARMRLILGLLAGVALIPLLLITGSRSGVVLGLLGILATRWIYRSPTLTAAPRRESKKRNYTPAILAIGVVVLATVTAVLAQVSVFERFAQGTDAVKDIRFQIWRPIANTIWDFFPFGSGLGSFPNVYKIYEPLALLDTRYLNHAHNDLLEIALTGGLAGLLILAFYGTALARLVLRAARRRNDGGTAVMNRMGATVVVLLSLASLVDYPLRTPSVACIFILATVCLKQERTSDHSMSTSSSHPLRASLHEA